MMLLLPVIGGVLAGWLAPTRAAIAMQVVFAVLGAGIVIASAPHHGTTQGAVAIWVIPLTIVLAPACLAIGVRLRRRRVAV
ncbi:MAG: hypothetical protein KDB02_15085 [Acidimicrobiales bacterium]|nr:hypothetical protein [Acidimicrobiales bacterium]